VRGHLGMKNKKHIMVYVSRFRAKREMTAEQKKKTFSGGEAAAKCLSFSHATRHSERSEESHETFTG